jgi:hypothetical protein
MLNANALISFIVLDVDRFIIPLASRFTYLCALCKHLCASTCSCWGVGWLTMLLSEIKELYLYMHKKQK